jgi:hypothetical protein
LPVFRASKIAPILASWRGPFGPSIMKPAGQFARARRTNSASAPMPPRVEEPRTAPKPKRWMKRAMYSPSKLCEVITTMRRRRKK